MTASEFVFPAWGVLALERSAAEFVAARRGRITPAEAAVVGARGATREARNLSASAPTLAVIPISGLIARGMPDWFGTDPHVTRQAVAQAAAAKDVAGIVYLVDSPGGEVTGVPELAAEMAAAVRMKPAVAIVTGMAASAAYWLVSGVPTHVIPSGEVGSIGVYVAHTDISGSLEQSGVRVTLVSSSVSPFKTERSPFAPLGDAARQDIQDRVDQVGAQFVNAVARGRGVPPAQVATKFGGGRNVDAVDAVRLGMVDGIGTPERILGTFLAGLQRRSDALIALARLRTL